MNSAKYVDERIKELKGAGIPLKDAAWEAAKLCEGWPYIFGAKGQYCTPDYRLAVYNKDPSQAKYANVKKSCPALNGGSCEGCKWFPNGERVRSFDCRGFTYWILKQIYNWTLEGSGATSQWNDADNWKARYTVDKLPEDILVCLFYSNPKNPKSMEHTGFAYKGQTMECSKGVQYSKTINKKWEYWGMPACEEGLPPDVPPLPEKKPTIRKGSTGKYVVECQEDLIKLGYNVGEKGADGKFGAATEKAVKEFQRDNGLTADGVVGQKTWDALDNAKPKPDPGPEPQPVKHKTLRKGDSGEEVFEMQMLLLDHGEALPKYGADGKYGQETVNAVKNFQMKNGLSVDGICGPKTWAALLK